MPGNDFKRDGKREFNSNKIMNTEVDVSRFNNSPMFEIWGLDAQGKSTSEYPLMKFGLFKAKAILKHMKDLQNFVDDYDRR